MNSQERDQLSQFLKQLTEVRLPTKDSEAEALIRDAVAKQPDAAYLLVQRSLLQEQALNNAKARIDELQNQLQNSQSGQRSGFLGSDPWAQPAANAAPVPGAGNYQMPRYAAQPQMQPQAQASGGVFGGGSSFLGNVATTAAGVVAGSFLFQGIENLMGHHGSSAWGGGQQPMAEEHFTEQTIVNNYYGDDATQLADNSGNDDNSDYLISADDDSFDDDDNDSSWV